jgi:hypothetical protein
MIIVHCPRCAHNYRLLQDEHLVGSKSEFWPDKYKCPRCEGPCSGRREGENAAGIEITDIEPTELYAAMHGLGLPGEMVCDGDTVKELLRGGVESVVGFGIPDTTRFVIEYIVTKGGTRIFLGSCPHGAVVYRIARHPQYAKRFLEQNNG